MENWSPGLDLILLVATLPAIATRAIQSLRHREDIVGPDNAQPVEIATGSVLRGGLARRQARLVREWANLHRVELLGAWRRASSGEPPGTIEPWP